MEKKTDSSAVLFQDIHMRHKHKNCLTEAKHIQEIFRSPSQVFYWEQSGKLVKVRRAKSSPKKDNFKNANV